MGCGTSSNGGSTGVYLVAEAKPQREHRGFAMLERSQGSTGGIAGGGGSSALGAETAGAVQSLLTILLCFSGTARAGTPDGAAAWALGEVLTAVRRALACLVTTELTVAAAAPPHPPFERLQPETVAATEALLTAVQASRADQTNELAEVLAAAQFAGSSLRAVTATAEHGAATADGPAGAESG